jgi:hypothetical protein
MQPSESGRVAWRVILIQLAILAGLFGFFKLYLPHREHEKAAHAASDREQKIEAFFRNMVEDTKLEIYVPLDGTVVKRHPQKLRTILDVADVETTLGAPDVASTDFQGGQHLTWIGTAHKVEAAFTAGRLYCLIREERSTGHGVMVFASPWTWHPY